MPELPDILTYLDCLHPRIVGHTIRRVRVVNPFLVRSVNPSLDSIEEKNITGLRRIGKRVVLELENDLFLVLHLMIAGRFRWFDEQRKSLPKIASAGLFFDHGTLLITEASTKKRASLHVVKGELALKAHDPGGLEVLDCGELEFRKRLQSENRMLKRALTSPKLFSGIGNAYGDEILHAAKLSPIRITSKLSAEEISQLYSAVKRVLTEWTEKLREEFSRTRRHHCVPTGIRRARKIRSTLPCMQYKDSTYLLRRK